MYRNFVWESPKTIKNSLLKKVRTGLNLNEQTVVDCHTINDLITTLVEEERTTYNSILRYCSLPISEYKKYASWCSDGYTRNCIAENEDFELILLCWEANQFTAIHDHCGEECWVKVIEGEFEETIYQPDHTGTFQQISKAVANEGDITYMIDFMGFHRLKNLSNKRSLSLHLYAKPIRKCNVYNEVTKELVNKDLSYDTIL